MPSELPTNVTIGSDHIWCQLFDSAKRFKTSRPTLFLDRDGVIVEEVHYLHKVEDVALIGGAAKIIRAANERDIPVVVVTNQSGLARDMFGWAQFNAVQAKMHELLKDEEGAFVDAVYACPFHKTGIEPFNDPDHEARKPNPGMLLRAMGALPIQGKGSWIVGDKASDLKAGLKAQISGGVHVLTGHGRDEGEADKAKAVAKDGFDVRSLNSIAEIRIDELF
ncbi:HAD family hydrolase [Terasakiella sp. SH-1]|uniref:D-glycero-alpha-D-manno-heptose-1,7-bisphosphate 7-phosphatase n=1 Tax=Terasakiella sp. SH-1 TaxID=2560057 RepID=UPI001074299A|nr:HAD family hydrolase [Terasakiella sp. SH-1]